MHIFTKKKSSKKYYLFNQKETIKKKKHLINLRKKMIKQKIFPQRKSKYNVITIVLSLYNFIYI